MRALALQQAIEQALEVVEAEIPDLDPACLAWLVFGDRDGTTECARQPLLEVAHRCGLLNRSLARLRLGRRALLLDQLFGRPDRQTLRDDDARGLFDRGGLVEAEQRPRVPLAEALILDQLADRERELVQADRVLDRAAVLAYPVGDLFVRHRELVDEALERRGLFERSEVGALEVIDERALDRALGIDFLDDDRDLVEAGALGRTPSPLAGDQEVALGVRTRPHDERRDHAVRPDRLGELGELRLVELAARLLGARIELLDPREEVRALALGRDAGRRGRRRGRQERAAAAAEPALLGIVGRHHAPRTAAGAGLVCTGTVRAMNSSATAR